MKPRLRISQPLRLSTRAAIRTGLFLGVGGLMAAWAFSFFSVQTSLSWTSLEASPTAACDSDTLWGVFDMGGASNVTVRVCLPNGMTYVPGSAQFTGGASLVTENATDPGKPLFTISNPASSVQFYLLRKASCEAYDWQISGGSLADTVKIFEAGLMVGSPEISNVYPVTYGSLSFSPATTLPSAAVVGGAVFRSVSVTNGNFGGVDTFWYAELFAPGHLLVDSFVINPGPGQILVPASMIDTIATLDSVILRFGAGLIGQLGDEDSLFENGETFILQYRLQVNACGNGANVASYPTIWWGCGDGYCQRYQQTAGVAMAQEEPDLNYGIYLQKNGCLGYGADPDTMLVLIHNVGDGPATEIEFGFQSQHPSQGGFNINQVTYSIDNGPPVPLTVFDLDKPVDNNFQCASDWPGPGALYSGGKVLLDIVLPAGSNVAVKFLEYNCCPSVCLNPSLLPENSVFHGSTYRVDSYFRFKNQCGQNPQDLGPGSLTPEQMSMVYTIAAPPNLSDGEPPVYTYIDFQELVVNGIVDVDDFAQAVFELDIHLPPCVDLAGAASSLEWVGKDGITIFPTLSAVASDSSVVAQWRLSDLSATELVNLNGTQIRFPITADCAEGNCNTESLDFDFTFIPSTTCNTCELIWICGESNVNLLCPSTCANGGGQLLRSVFERQNLGRPDADNNGCPDNDNNCNGAGVLSSKVFNEALVRRDRAVSGDTILSEVEGIILSGAVASQWQYLFFENQLSEAAYLEVIEASMRWVDVSAGNVEYQASGLVPSIFSDTVRLNLSIPAVSAALGLPSGSYFYQDGDTLEVTIRYRLTDELGTASEAITTLNRFYTSTVASPGLSQRYDCATTGGSIVAGNPGVSNYKSWITYPTGCASKNIGFNTEIALDGASAGNNFFPFEYRVWGQPSAYIVTIPQGYRFDRVRLFHRRTTGNGTVSPSYYTPNLTATDSVLNPDGAITYTYDINHPVNAGIWAANGGNYYYSDDGAYFRFNAEASPGCGSPAEWYSDIAGGNAYLQQHKYTDVMGITRYRTGSTNLLFSKPDITPTCAIPVKEGVNTNVSWEVKLRNLSSSIPVNYTWMALVSPSGLVGSGTLELRNQSNTLLSPASGGLYTLGTFAKNSTQTFFITADYANCDMDSLLLIAGWNCGGYPASVGDYPCQADTIKLYVIPVDGQISMVVTSLANTPTNPANGASTDFGQDSILLCDVVPVEFKLNSALPGGLQQVFALMDVPISGGAGGLEYVAGSGFFEYPIGSTPQPFSSVAEADLLAQNGSGQFLLDWSDIAGSALPTGAELPGTSSPSNARAVYIRMNMMATCALPVGDKFNIRAFANYGCGAPAIGFGENLSGSALHVEGVLPDYTATVNVGSIPVFESFAQGYPVRITIGKNGTTPVGSGDSLLLRLPEGLTLDGAGVCISGTCPDFSASTMSIVAGQKVYLWPMPALGNGQSCQFDLPLRLVKNVYGVLGQVEVQVRNEQQLACATASDGLCPNNGVILAGSGARAASASLPEVFPMITGLLATQESGSLYRFFADLQLVTGGKESPGGYWVELYCADPATETSTGLPPMDSVWFPGPIPAGSLLDTLVIFLSSACDPTTQGLLVMVPDTSHGGSQIQAFSPQTHGRNRGASGEGGNPFDWMMVQTTLLPIEWINLGAEERRGEVQLTWEVAQTDNIIQYEVERMTGKGFVQVGTMAAKKGKEASYQWREPASGQQQMLYFRIRARDLDGSNSLSPLISLQMGEATMAIRLLDNPAQSQLRAALTFPESGAVLRIWSMQGQLLHQTRLQPGETNFQLPVESWARGTYLLSLSAEGAVITEKVLLR